MLSFENLQLKRGGKDTNDRFIGYPGSVAIDYETQTIRVHDGVTAGGAFRVKNLEELKDNTFEFIRATWRGVAGEGSIDFNTTGIDYEDLTRIRVYLNNVEVSDEDWELLQFDEETLTATIRITAYLEPGFSVRVDQFVTIQDIVQAVVAAHIEDLDLNGYIAVSEKGAPMGVAELGFNGKIPLDQIPKLTDLDYPVEHVYTTGNVIDLGDLDTDYADPGSLDPNVPDEVLTIFNQVDFRLMDGE